MTAKRKINLHGKQAPYWNQQPFDEFQASLSPERIAEDRKILRDVFKLAADSSLLAEELAWAKKRGVKFFVDRTIDGGLAGYYMPGSGVLGIGANAMQNADESVKIIAHELRHAWQEDNGMGCNWDSDSYAGYFINIALIEADAYAFGLRARDQYRTAQGVDASIYAADEKADLSKKFEEWFLPSAGQTVFYGEDFSELYARSTGIPLAEESQPAPQGPGMKEFSACLDVKLSKISIANVQDILFLGDNFSGTANYLAHLPPDVLLKIVLRSSLAHTFWDAADPEQKKLLAEMRKFDIRAKLAQPKRRHNLP